MLGRSFCRFVWTTTQQPSCTCGHVLLASRYPVAKLVKSTNAKSVIPVLRGTYDLFGNSLRQKKDNGPPFNSDKMEKFSKNRNIEQVKTPPGHTAAKNIENLMKLFGKAMKTGNMQNFPDQETLSAFLTSYRDAPHVSNGVPPAQMLFRDGYRNNFPYQQTSHNRIIVARQTDRNMKKERKFTYNSSRHTVDMNYEIGDQVLRRNYKKKSKFDPYYLPEKFVIMEVLAKGYILLVKSLNTGKCLMRHPNDVKLCEGDIADHSIVPGNPDNKNDWKKAFEFISSNDQVHYDDSKQNYFTANPTLRRSGRIRKPNPRIILLHKTCVNICRALNNMHPSPPSLGHLQTVIGMEMMC